MLPVAGEMISLSNVFKISHYQQKAEKRILEIKKIEPVTPLPVLNDEANDQGIHEEILQARLEAQRILDEANAEIAKLKQEALQEIENWKIEEQKQMNEESEKLFQITKQNAYQEGYKDGFDQGILEGKQQYEHEIAHAQSLILQAEADWKKRIVQSEPYVIDLVIEIAKKVIQRELLLDQNSIVGIVQEALKQSSELKEITVLLHPKDYDVVRSRIDELKRYISNQANLILVPDHSITSGGCMIRTSLGTLDARVDTQLEEIKKALMDVVEGCELDELESIGEV